MKKVAFIFGGESSEYGVSLHSVGSCIQFLDRNKFEPIFIGINQQGSWFLYEGAEEKIEQDLWSQDEKCYPIVVSLGKKGGIFAEKDKQLVKVECDVIFPILHGKNGEDGSLQGLLQLAHIPYVGCGLLTSAVAMDKAFTHLVCEANQIPMAKYFTLKQYEKYDLQNLSQKINELGGFPVFIKPARVGSSYGISKVKTLEDLPKAIQMAFEYDNKLVVEQAITGFEVGCAIAKGKDKLVVGDVDEIEIFVDFFDFEAKYEDKGSIIHCPARINLELKTKIQQMASKIYQVLECDGLSRIDLFVTEDKKLIFNEINTLPGFTAHSRYPSMMREVGYDFKELVTMLIEYTLQEANLCEHGTK